MADSLGTAIREGRSELGMTLERLAEAAGTCKSHIWEIEKGRTDPSFSLVVRIARALDVPLVFFAHYVKGADHG